MLEMVEGSFQDINVINLKAIEVVLSNFGRENHVYAALKIGAIILMLIR